MKAECGTDATAICTPLTQKEAYATGFTGVGGVLSSSKNALRIDDAAWCGHCTLDRRHGA